MPAEFDACRAAGGKIRTISGPNKQYGLNDNQYMHICIKKNGGVVLGEKKEKVKIEPKG
jgi:hypothetical protein